MAHSEWGILKRAIIEFYMRPLFPRFFNSYSRLILLALFLCVSPHFVVFNSTKHSNFIIILRLPIDKGNCRIEWRTNTHLVWGPCRPSYNYSHNLSNRSIRPSYTSKFWLSFMALDIEVVIWRNFYMNTECDLPISP